MPPREDERDAASAAGGHTISFVTVGRTTRRKHAVVVRFAFHEGAYFVMGGGGRSDWFANALASKSGRLVAGGRAEVVAAEQFYGLDLVKGLFAKKYGIPTVKETGIGDFDASTTYAIFGPTGTPQAAIDWLDTEIKRALDDPDVQQKLRAAGVQAEAPGNVIVDFGYEAGGWQVENILAFLPTLRLSSAMAICW